MLFDVDGLIKKAFAYWHARLLWWTGTIRYVPWKQPDFEDISALNKSFKVFLTIVSRRRQLKLISFHPKYDFFHVLDYFYSMNFDIICLHSQGSTLINDKDYFTRHPIRLKLSANGFLSSLITREVKSLRKKQLTRTWMGDFLRGKICSWYSCRHGNRPTRDIQPEGQPSCPSHLIVVQNE